MMHGVFKILKPYFQVWCAGLRRGCSGVHHRHTRSAASCAGRGRGCSMHVLCVRACRRRRERRRERRRRMHDCELCEHVRRSRSGIGRADLSRRREHPASAGYACRVSARYACRVPAGYANQRRQAGRATWPHKDEAHAQLPELATHAVSLARCVLPVPELLPQPAACGTGGGLSGWSRCGPLQPE